MRRAKGFHFLLWVLFLISYTHIDKVQAAKLVEVSVLDKDYLVVHLSDGDVIHHEGNTGEEIIRYTPELDTGAALQTGNWTITSSDDSNYSDSRQNPKSCRRKKKLSGHAQLGWSGSDYIYEYTYDHWIYLELPSSLRQGATYTLAIDPDTHSDTASVSMTFDIYHSRSEAIHINLVGYATEATHKAADLYCWMGSGGARNYASFQGNPVYLFNVSTKVSTQVGAVDFWMAGGSDVGWYNLTRSDVWRIDFSNFSTPGIYRLVVEGVGCSQDFEIAADVYADPFRVSLRGYFYMRIGESNPTGITPPPRTPLYIPGTSPADTTVYLTTMHPYHPDWDTFASGDKWDRPDSWVPYVKSGDPTNNNAWGGHSDAADWDRHLRHVVNIYDMLLPFLMTGGAIADDNTGITESGNGIPDIIDEARNEVDFWLRLRDGDGYSHGLTNPNSGNALFQAGPTAIAAWANAANAAMLADALRIAGRTTLATDYTDKAAAAYHYANALADPMLDQGLDLDDGFFRGRDLKMTAAAFLYNVTGDQAYENIVNSESVCSSSPSTLKNGSRNQIYAAAAYLMTDRPVHYPTLQQNMKIQIISEARSTEAGLCESRPSRRSTDQRPSYWRTAHFVQRTIIAHAVADDPADQDLFRKALGLEADWGLGRNPLNMIQMTTAFTPLESKRSVTEAYTSGRDDGFAGVHPGHTPYMNLDDWGTMVMARPSALHHNSYPADVASTWPIGEAYYPSRWVWAHNEFTPRQTMRGKMALYGYLYGLAENQGPENPMLTVTNEALDGGSGSVTSQPGGIDCGIDCDEAYPQGTTVTLTASADNGSVFRGWRGACSGNHSTCELIMKMNRSVTATFEPEDSGSTPPDSDDDDGDNSGSGGDGCFISIHRCFQ
jgi:hypothetical protein